MRGKNNSEGSQYPLAPDGCLIWRQLRQRCKPILVSSAAAALGSAKALPAARTGPAWAQAIEHLHAQGFSSFQSNLLCALVGPGPSVRKLVLTTFHIGLRHYLVA